MVLPHRAPARTSTPVMRGFDAYVPDKMSHQPLTFIRSPVDGTWVRMVGLAGSREPPRRARENSCGWIGIRGGARNDETELGPTRSWSCSCCCAAAAGPALAGEQETVAGLPADEALRLGERMYREGILPSGEPMMALVSEDIEVDGTMFSCRSCRLRSGRGSLEGTVITLPTCGSWLYKPLVGREMRPQSEARLPDRLNPPPFRQAYTDRLVGGAIWAGKDANGRELSWVMPRYKMSTRDMEIMVYYLKNLSAEFSPGVDDTTLRFATVVEPRASASPTATPCSRFSQAIVRDRNSQSRHDERRAQDGAGSTWRSCTNFLSPLLARSLGARRRPVNLVRPSSRTTTARRRCSRCSAGSPRVIGGPIHSFCRAQSDTLPAADYRLSLWCPTPTGTRSSSSKGYYQEGETAARFLGRMGRRCKVTSRSSRSLRDRRRRPRCWRPGFAAARSSRGMPARQGASWSESERSIDRAFWSRLVADNPGAVLALWLEPGEGGERSAAPAAAEPRPPAVLVSSSFLGDTPRSVLPPEGSPVHFHHLTNRSRRTWVGRGWPSRSWLRAKGLPVTNFEIQAKGYFLGWMLAGDGVQDDAGRFLPRLFSRCRRYDARRVLFGRGGLPQAELRARPALRLQGLLCRPTRRRRPGRRWSSGASG